MTDVARIVCWSLLLTGCAMQFNPTAPGVPEDAVEIDDGVYQGEGVELSELAVKAFYSARRWMAVQQPCLAQKRLYVGPATPCGLAHQACSYWGSRFVYVDSTDGFGNPVPLTMYDFIIHTTHELTHHRQFCRGGFGDPDHSREDLWLRPAEVPGRNWESVQGQAILGTAWVWCTDPYVMSHPEQFGDIC